MLDFRNDPMQVGDDKIVRGQRPSLARENIGGERGFENAIVTNDAETAVVVCIISLRLGHSLAMMLLDRRPLGPICNGGLSQRF
jgi:hypothetical protein